MTKKFLVTGGNGFIGSHMCKYLHRTGNEVFVIDNHSTSPNYNVHKFGQFYRFDIGDGDELQRFFDKHQIDCIFHFAAKALVGESQLEPIFYFKENISKTLTLLDSCIKNKVRSFVFSSSCATYGDKSDPISEESEQTPINSYGLSKLVVEQILRDLSAKNLIDVAVLRYFNASGCSPEAELGENHEPETHLIPNLIKSYLKKEVNKFFIFGTNYSTKDGTCVRDYIHVEDLVRAHSLAANFIGKNRGFYDFNLGSGVGYSVLEVIRAFEKITNAQLDITFGARRPGDPPSLISDPSKAQRVLGFTPEYSLEQSIEHSLNYLSSLENVNRVSVAPTCTSEQSSAFV